MKPRKGTKTQVGFIPERPNALDMLSARLDATMERCSFLEHRVDALARPSAFAKWWDRFSFEKLITASIGVALLVLIWGGAAFAIHEAICAVLRSVCP